MGIGQRLRFSNSHTLINNAEASDNAPALANTLYNVSSRPRTIARVHPKFQERQVTVTGYSIG